MLPDRGTVEVFPETRSGDVQFLDTPPVFTITPLLLCRCMRRFKSYSDLCGSESARHWGRLMHLSVTPASGKRPRRRVARR